MRRLINFKALTLSFFVSLLVLLFLGSMVVSHGKVVSNYSDNNWYYLNRGFSQSWSGVGLATREYRFPIVVMPFLNPDDYVGTKLVKIVNAQKFTPIFLLMFAIAYIPSYIFAKAVEENKKLFPDYIFFVVLFVLLSGGVYFTWFSSI